MLIKLNPTLSAIVIITSVFTTPLSAQIQTVLLTGDPVPNFPEQFVAFGALGLNDEGTVVFGSKTTSANGQSASGTWVKGLDGIAKPILMAGDQAFDLPPGVVFRSGSALYGFGNSGDVAFVGSLTGPGIIENNGGTCGTGPPDADRGIWRSDGDRGILIARQGDPAPGLPADEFFRCLVLRNFLNNRGEVAFYGRVGELRTGRGGVWRSDGSGGIELVAIDGEQASEIQETDGSSSTLTLRATSLVGFNDRRSIAVRASVNSLSILSIALPNEPRRLLAMARFMSPFEEANSSISLQSFGATALSNRDQIAAQVVLQGAGVVHPRPLESSRPEPQSPPSNDRAIFAFEVGQEPKTLIQSGRQPAGIESNNIVYYGFGGISTPVFDNFEPFWLADLPFGFNDDGQILYRAVLNSIETEPTLDATNDEGLWISDMLGNDRLILREGDLAPGTSEPFVLGGTSVDYSLNKLGQVAVEASVGGKNGIWATDSENNLQLIAIEGQSLALGPNDTRVVAQLFTRLSLSVAARSTNSSSLSNFNDRGQLAFSVVFTDGTQGLFVSNLVAIPEPATWLLVVGGAFVGCTRRSPTV